MMRRYCQLQQKNKLTMGKKERDIFNFADDVWVVINNVNRDKYKTYISF